jgi:peptidoglycan glycosyltransferase
MLGSLLLSFLFLGGMVLVAGAVLLSALRRPRPVELAEDAPVDAASYGPARTNRLLMWLRVAFVLLCAVILGAHGYWVYAAPDEEDFARYAGRDQRNRRLAASGLKGWIYDRAGSPERALVRYHWNGRAIVRDYPLGASAVHVVGYSDFIYGATGIERAYSDYLVSPSSLFNWMTSPVPVGQDLTTTIDRDLQQAAYALLAGKRGAVVVLSVPDCEVLAAASSPSFEPSVVVVDEARWRQLNVEADLAPELSPMTNRATATYYLPGSTFKVLVATAALENGLGDARFTCSADGFLAPRSRQPILDDTGGGHGNIGLARALEVSCNQYFAQLGLELGTARLASVAHRCGIETGGPSGRRDVDLFRYKRAAPAAFNIALAPPPSRVELPAGFAEEYQPYDLAIQSFGQGRNQMTILQMALIAAAVASPDGKLLKPTYERDADPVPLGQFGVAENLEKVRAMMRAVVETGTAARAFASLRGRVSSGGKTGTAQRLVTVYDERTMEPRVRRDAQGREHVIKEESIDALFIGFAPYEKPRIAYAVIVENGGHGGTAAAPVAVGLIRKALELGLIPASPQAKAAGAGGRRR